MDRRPHELKVLFYMIILTCFEICYCDSKTLSKNQKIIIIGSGPAGIAAASKLLENGFVNVTILEAEDRIGGRVHTTRFGNYTVDLGGQWVHGIVGNVAYALANPLGLLEESDEPDDLIRQKFIDSSGNRLNKNISDKLSIFVQNHIINDNFTNENTVGEYVEKMFNQEFADNADISRNKEKYLKLIELMSLSSESAQSWHEVSTKGDFEEYPGDKMVNWKERGYSTILDILIKRFPYPEEELPVLKNTILNTEVTSIDYSKTTNDLPILIRTANGQLHMANHVIVTIPLGVLKAKHETLFIPPLPKYKVEAIKSLGFGSVAKIYVLFDKPFWNIGNNRTLHFLFVWNDEDQKLIEADPEKRWLLGMFAAITVEHKPNLLELWNSGKYADEMETIPEDKVFNHTTENLHRFFDKIYNMSEPIAMLRTQWRSNPHFNGTYSYTSVEAARKKITPNELEKPLSPKLDILFAGEATSNKRHSTVDGAISSGWKAADRLIDHYKT